VLSKRFKVQSVTTSIRRIVTSNQIYKLGSKERNLVEAKIIRLSLQITHSRGLTTLQHNSGSNPAQSVTDTITNSEPKNSHVRNLQVSLSSFHRTESSRSQFEILPLQLRSYGFFKGSIMHHFSSFLRPLFHPYIL
jgi:hypothetical protein